MLGHHLRAGDLLARRYLLNEQIGAGGMSAIWRATDEALQRVVAVKVLDGPLGTDRGDRDQIRREARAAARIAHPNAISVYDYGETVTPRGRIAAYVVMQLLDGESLAARLEHGRMPWPEAVAVAATVADVLAAAHRCGVVHRDVTPENVMLTTDGVKLLDFGIAADIGQREDTVTFGTPPYVAPERFTGATASGATDVYALGVLLFECLTGHPPYPGITWDDVASADRAVPPPLRVPGLPPSVESTCRRCLAADPQSRPSAAEVAAALRPAPSATSPEQRWLPGAVVVLATLLVAVVVLALVVLSPTERIPPNLNPHAQPGLGSSLSPRPDTGPNTDPDRTDPTPRPSSNPSPDPSLGSSPDPSRDPGQGPNAVSSAGPSIPGTVSVEFAGRLVLDIIDRRAATGHMRPDVAQDLRNQVGDLLYHPAAPAHRIANLRKSLRDRQRERGISAEALAELDGAIVALGAALTR
jgi:eukaryotic-like serine/threonine-protein kinase